MKKIFFLILNTISLISYTYAQAPAIEWQKCFGGTSEENANSIQQTSDGGYIVAGNSWSNDGDVTGNHGSDYWVVKLNDIGTIEWQKALGGTGWSIAYSVTQTTDGGYIVAGESNAINGDVTGHHFDVDSTYNNDFWVVKLDANGVIQWQKSLGGTKDENARSIQQTSDGGYIVAGFTQSNDGDVTGNHGSGIDYWVVKINQTGIIEWQKTLGGTGNEQAYSIQQTSDGGYVVAGKSSSSDGDVTGNHGSGDYWVVKLNQSGTIEWQKSLGGMGDDEASSIRQTSDGGYFVTGNSASTNGDVTGNHGNADYWVVKLNANGTIQWQKSLGGTDIDEARSVWQTLDGGCVIAGFTNSSNGDVIGNHGGWEYWVVKLDDNGVIEWKKAIGGTDHDYLHSIQQTSDGGFIMAGFSQSTNGDIINYYGAGDYFVVKLYADDVGISIAETENFKFSPNPATTEITVSGYSPAYLKLCDAVGQTVAESKSNKLYVGNLSQGLYVLQLFDANGQQVKTEKVIVAK